MFLIFNMRFNDVIAEKFYTTKVNKEFSTIIKDLAKY